MVVFGIICLTAVSFGSQSAMAANLGQTNCGREEFLGFRAWYDGLCEGDEIKTPSKNDDKALATFIWTIILNVLTDISIAIGYLAVGFVIYGGYLYIMSQGDPGKMARGKKTLTSAVIGTVIAISASVVVNTAKAALLISDADGWKQTSNVHEIVQNAFSWACAMAGLVAVVFIVRGGVEYVMSQGDPGKVQKATRSIIFSVAGLIIVLLAFAIVTTILNVTGKAL